MNHAQRKTIRVLNDLAAACRDSEEGFGKAAKGVHSEALRDLFTSISRERAGFAAQLLDQARRPGGEPRDAGRFGGILRGGWVDLEARIRPQDDGSFLDDCERGEEGTLKHYRHALEQDLPSEERAVVECQLRSVEEALERLRAGRQVRRAG